SRDELTASRANLAVAEAHLRAPESEAARLRAEFDAHAAAIEEKKLEIGRNLRRIEACDALIQQILRHGERPADEALDE
ncbi:hypothetical protein AAHH80_39780, partial [Burkholderia pseudomallei]